MNNISFNDREIDIALRLISSYRKNVFIEEPTNANPAATTDAYLKRIERKLSRALEHPHTDFVEGEK